MSLIPKLSGTDLSNDQRDEDATGRCDHFTLHLICGWMYDDNSLADSGAETGRWTGVWLEIHEA